MKEQDSVMKTLESYNDVFADIVNVLIFGGKRVVRTNALTDAIPYSYYKAGKSPPGENTIVDVAQYAGSENNTSTEAKGKKNASIHGQERDVAKFWKRSRIRLCLFGLENQTTIEPMMPLRVMSYDAANYMGQFLEKGKIQCYPVVTLVLYFGTERKWTKNLTLKDLFRVPPGLEPFVFDYGINVVNLAWLSDEQIKLFKSDFREIVVYLRCLRTGELYRGSRRKLRHAFETLDFFRIMSCNEERFQAIRREFIKMMKQNNQGGDVIMYDPLRWIEEEGFDKGLRDGRKEGHAQGAADATNTLTALFAQLRSSGRDADLDRALADRAYLNELLKDFALAK